MTLRAYWRFLVVIWRFLPLLLSYARDRRRFLLFGRSREVSSERRRKRAERLLESLLTLGPTFIKLGQLLSTRPDILPPEYLAEFTKLQDRVPPASWAETETIIEDELGPVDEAFDSFDTEPISGASLGQVYVAEFDGQQVAVKVRRPGVEDLVEADLRAIRWSLPILMRFVGDARSFSLETLADEFAKTIRQEMNYEREASMLTEIRGNFAGNDTIRIPRVIEARSTGRVLTMEYVEGTKINDLGRLDELGIDRSQLAERLQYIYLQMMLDDGIFHADPHPGNLAVTDEGTIIMYDFGMSGYIDPFFQDSIVEFYSAVARQDIDAILDALIEMGSLSPDADRQLMSDILELAITDLRGGDVDQYRIQEIVGQIEDTIYEFPLRLPSNLALVIRVATVVEGVCVALDPEFDFIKVGREYLASEGYLEAGVKQYVTDRGADIRNGAGSAIRIPPKLESTLDTVNRDNLKVNAALRDPDNYFDRLARRVVWALLFATGILSTTILAVGAPLEAALVAGALTAVVGFKLRQSFKTGFTLYTEPQFTRQRLRGREEETAALGFGDAFADDQTDEADSGTAMTADIPVQRPSGTEPSDSSTAQREGDSGEDGSNDSLDDGSSDADDHTPATDR